MVAGVAALVVDDAGVAGLTGLVEAPVIELFASTFIATTKVSELIAAMYSLKIPRSITITFAMVLRFFPTFSEEIHNIYDAMKLRGIALSWKNVFTRPMLILEAITIPIVMRSASIARKVRCSHENYSHLTASQIFSKLR